MTDEEIISLYVDKKLGLNQIYYQYNITSTQVMKLLKKNNIPLRTRNATRQYNFSKEELEDLYINKNLSACEIGRLKNTSATTITRYLRKFNIAIKQNFWTDDKLNKCRSLIQDGKSYTEIANYFGVTVSAISNLNLKILHEFTSQWDKVNEAEMADYLKKTKNYKETSTKFGIFEEHLIDRNNKKWHIDLSSNSTLFGIPTEFNKIKYRSKSEAEIAEFLTQNNIEFEYEKRVKENSNLSCDFYLPKFDIWLEYDGLGKFRTETGYPEYSKKHPKIAYFINNKIPFFILKPKKWKEQISAIIANKSCKDLSVEMIDRKQGNYLLENYHYLGSAPKGTLYYFGLFYDTLLIGIATFGLGANKHLSTGIGEEQKALELTRFYTVDWSGPNFGSFFLSKTIKLLRKERKDLTVLVAYSDPEVSHTGGLYKACNWKFTGQCKKDYCYIMPDGTKLHKSKFRCKDGKTEKQLALEAGASKISISGKYKFIYQL